MPSEHRWRPFFFVFPAQCAPQSLYLLCLGWVSPALPPWLWVGCLALLHPGCYLSQPARLPLPELLFKRACSVRCKLLALWAWLPPWHGVEMRRRSDLVVVFLLQSRTGCDLSLYLLSYSSLGWLLARLQCLQGHGSTEGCKEDALMACFGLPTLIIVSPHYSVTSVCVSQSRHYAGRLVTWPI